MTAPPAQLWAGEALAPADYADLRRRMIFEYGKWNPQCGDVAVLAAYPLVLSAEAWSALRLTAERLAREVLAAERELALRPELHGVLALPRLLRKALRQSARGESPLAPRYVRFDFHPTTDGWRISEANTDVPGGLIETAGLSRLMGAISSDAGRLADPAEVVAGALAEMVDCAAPAGGDASERGPLPYGRGSVAQHSVALGVRHVALVHATAYTDDRQEIEYLRRCLAERGIVGVAVSPTHLRAERGRVFVVADGMSEPERIDAIFRFFPAEWLANLPRGRGMEFIKLPVPHCNPVSALLTQSKRFPLVWDRLETPLPTWRALLPDTRDPRAADWRRDAGWVLKAALGRVGEEVALPGVTPEPARRQMVRDVRWHPSQWIAQRRFDAVAIPTPDGPRYPCLGVFVVNERCAGIYGRVARAPLINSHAQDVAVLVEQAKAAGSRPVEELTHVHSR